MQTQANILLLNFLKENGDATNLQLKLLAETFISEDGLRKNQ